MEQITVKRNNVAIKNLRSTSPVWSITKAEWYASLMSEDVVQISTESVNTFDFHLGDSVNVFGKDYFLNQLPTVKKISELKFTHDFTFEYSHYDLLKVQFFNYDVNFGGNETDFSLTGNLDFFANVLINNLNRVYPTKWSIGEIPLVSDVKTLDFATENCLAAFNKILSEYEIEFEIIQGASNTRVINIKKIGSVLSGSFEYGKGKGLYGIERIDISDKKLVTKLYPFGSDQNIKSTYRNGSKRLKISDANFLINQPAIDAYGVFEVAKTFDEIKPERTGTISAIGTNINTFTDISMFDLNETDTNGTKWLIPSLVAKINILTGQLAGYTFDLASFNSANKIFTLKPYTDDRGMIFPSVSNTTFRFAIGDKYTLTDITMPDSYVLAAEKRLLEKATEYLFDNSQPELEYNIYLDEMFLKNYTPSLALPPVNVPTGWVYTDINTSKTGTAQLNNGIVMVSQGADIDGTSDSFGFLHKSAVITGGIPIEISAILEMQANNYSGSAVNLFSKYGIMIRWGLGASDKFVAIGWINDGTLPNGKLYVFYRLTVGGTVQYVSSAITVKSKIKLGVDDLDIVTPYKLIVNKFWNTFGTQQMTLTSGEKTAARFGFFNCSHSSSELSVVRISETGIGESLEVTVPPPAVTGGLNGFNYININNGAIGNGSWADPNYKIICAGTDIWGATDSFGFLYKSALANSTFQANIAQLPNYSGTNTVVTDFAKCGLMFRTGLNNNDKFCAIIKNKNGWFSLFRRNASGLVEGIVNVTNPVGIISEFRLVKSTAANNIANIVRTNFTAFYKNSDNNWIEFGNTFIDTPNSPTFYLGFVNTSESASLKAELNISNLVFDENTGVANVCGKTDFMQLKKFNISYDTLAY